VLPAVALHGNGSPDRPIAQSPARQVGRFLIFVPSHTVQLAAVYLDRNVEKILASPYSAKPSVKHKQDSPRYSTSAAQ
jgi:hypothetical protein